MTRVIYALVFLALLSLLTGCGDTPQASGATDTPTPTSRASVQPTAPPQAKYPPKTLTDLRLLAAKGSVSAIQEFHSESVGLVGACPQPKREITVDKSLTGQKLAEALLAYFYGQGLDSPCGSLVLAYHKQSEANDTYTAGRISLAVNGTDGSSNTDPNGTGLTYVLTLDIGGLTDGQEYLVTYTK